MSEIADGGYICLAASDITLCVVIFACRQDVFTAVGDGALDVPKFLEL